METLLAEIPVLKKTKEVKAQSAQAASSCCSQPANGSSCCTPSKSVDENDGACCTQPADGSACCDK